MRKRFKSKGVCKKCGDKVIVTSFEKETNEIVKKEFEKNLYICVECEDSLKP